VFVDGPGGGAPSDQQRSACYDYETDHDSISSWDDPAKPDLTSKKIVQLGRTWSAYTKVDSEMARMLDNVAAPFSHWHFASAQLR
jgi:hypothetical protein